MSQPAVAQGSGGSRTNVRRAILSGLCASLVGIGLARFSYTPLIPALIAADWFEATGVVYLGAANLAGYLAGALVARPMRERLPAPGILRAMMVTATIAFFACALPLSFTWYFLWRFAAGLAGGVLMVLAAASVLPLVPAARRGLAGGAIFTGVGLGIAASGTLVPAALHWGLIGTWCSLGTLALLLTLIAWRGWPADAVVKSERLPAARSKQRRPASFTANRALKALWIEYALNAVGLVPHMVFLVDFIARGLDRGLVAGAGYWVLFGVGAIFGPLLSGYAADRIGFGPALRLAFLIQATSVAWIAVSGGTGALVLSSLVVGAFVPGIVPLVLGRVHELVPHEGQERTAAWSYATLAFALGQAAAAYGYSFLFDLTGNYTLLFQLAAAALVLALAIDFFFQPAKDKKTAAVVERG